MGSMQAWTLVGDHRAETSLSVWLAIRRRLQNVSIASDRLLAIGQPIDVLKHFLLAITAS